MWQVMTDEDISFPKTLCSGENARCNSSVEGLARNQAKCAVHGKLTSSFMDIRGLLPCFVEDGELFGDNDVLSSPFWQTLPS